ncbi:putative ethanolamine kinase A-like protein, partial [Trifolium pratense]
MINHEEGHELGLMSPVFNVEELNRNALYLIDYEYASYNYRGFDIGNHFAEYAGFECDYSLYPDMNEQYHFFRHYLQPDRPHEVEWRWYDIVWVEFRIWSVISSESQSLVLVPENDLKTLYVEANIYALASHLFWSLWGLIQ